MLIIIPGLILSKLRVRWILLELQVTNSPFNQEQAELLNRLLPTLTETQRIWLSGYLTALQGAASAASGAAPDASPLTAVAANAAANLQRSDRALRITDRQQPRIGEEAVQKAGRARLSGNTVTRWRLQAESLKKGSKFVHCRKHARRRGSAG